MNDIERIIRPIVEGQIRGFLKEHPGVVEAVDWYKPRQHDKATTFINSLAKRIVRDLTCGCTTARLAAALASNDLRGQPDSSVARVTAVEVDPLGNVAERADAAAHMDGA